MFAKYVRYLGHRLGAAGKNACILLFQGRPDIEGSSFRPSGVPQCLTRFEWGQAILTSPSNVGGSGHSCPFGDRGRIVIRKWNDAM